MDAGEPSRQRFDGTDLAGAVFCDVDLSGATITGLISGLTINEVEVEPLITAELDRRRSGSCCDPTTQTICVKGGRSSGINGPPRSSGSNSFRLRYSDSG